MIRCVRTKQKESDPNPYTLSRTQTKPGTNLPGKHIVSVKRPQDTQSSEGCQTRKYLRFFPLIITTCATQNLISFLDPCLGATHLRPVLLPRFVRALA